MKININKDKLVMSITIGISCFALMLVMFMQFKVVNETDLTEIKTMKESELKSELISWKERYAELNERYTEVVEKIEEYKSERVSDEKTAQLLENDLKRLNELLGKTDVIGEGIVIQIVDKGGEMLEEDTYIYAIEAQDLLLIVNQLFAAGAEAISINGNRIIPTSAIVDISNAGFIMINSKRIPDNTYVINAIGNQDYLRGAVLGKGGQLDELKELGHEVSVENNKNILIEKYDGEINTRYID